MTCPCCSTEFPWDAGLIEIDAKRLAAVVADMEPALARAAMSYLRLFKPPKTALRLTRASKLLQEVAALSGCGTVSKDDRSNITRPAPATTWVAGIEQMLGQADRLALPLTSHGYLRQVVFGLADQADAAAERQREADKHTRRKTEQPAASNEVTRHNLALHESLMRIEADLRMGLIKQDEATSRIAAARQQQGGAP